MLTDACAFTLFSLFKYSSPSRKDFSSSIQSISSLLNRSLFKHILPPFAFNIIHPRTASGYRSRFKSYPFGTTNTPSLFGSCYFDTFVFVFVLQSQVMAGTEDDTGIYPYKPNSKICIVAALLFGGSALFHVWQMLRKKTWFYTPLVVGSLSEFSISQALYSMSLTPLVMTLGYIARYFSAKSPASMMPYIAQSLFIILPPSLYAATIYMIYGRIAVFVNSPDASIIRPTRVTKIFVIGDVVAFLMQAGGGGMMAQSSMASIGQKIMLFGLFVQLIFFGFFLFVALIFFKRMRFSPARFTIPTHSKRTWVHMIKLLFAAAVIIILRCIFRIIEFSQGHSGYLASHEIYLYIFDTFPMFLVQSMFHVVHAGDFLPAGFAMNKLDDNTSEENIGLR